MSSECTIVSPSQVVFGPGGCLTEVSTPSKWAIVSAGEEPRWAATPLSCTLSKLNPEEISLAKKAGGVSVAADVIWASTSRTVHWLHSEGVSHCSPVTSRRSVARALRSAWIVGQVSMSPPLGRQRCRLGVLLHAARPGRRDPAQLPAPFAPLLQVGPLDAERG